MRGDDDCVEKCLERKFTQPRPYYVFAGPGENCQDWAKDSLVECFVACIEGPPSPPFCQLNPSGCQEMMRR